MSSTAQRAWRLFEPIHAVTYFAPEARAAYEDAGLRGFWRGYFAGRMAPFGAVGPEVATAVCFVFAPPMVARALPDVWARCSPEQALDARLDGARRALEPVLHGADLRDAVTLARAAVDACDLEGRPLFAANRPLPWPDDALGALWHATTLLREHRGDGHVHALMAAGLGSCDALVLHAATGVPEPTHLRENRGWTDDEWAAAGERLIARGWLDRTGAITAAGRDTREAIERHTDTLASTPYERLGDERAAALLGALAPLAAAVRDAEIVPYPNPMGVPRPDGI